MLPGHIFKIFYFIYLFFFERKSKQQKEQNKKEKQTLLSTELDVGLELTIQSHDLSQNKRVLCLTNCPSLSVF